MSHRQSPYTFYASHEYYQTLIDRINKTKVGDRVVLVTLLLVPGQALIDDVLTAAGAAARRGVEVRLLVDAFTFLIKHGITPGPAFFYGTKTAPYMSRAFRRRRAAMQQLEAAGAHCMIINAPKRSLTSPFAGRSHMKFTVVNNDVFVGGCNLADAGNTDLMIGWQDTAVADWLYGLALDIMATGSVATALHGKDVQLPVDTTTTLLVDAGVPGQSVIFDRVLTLTDEAEKRLLVTYQYYPRKSAAQHLARAHERGVDLKIIYNHPSKHTRPLNMVYSVSAWASRRRMPGSFLANRLPKAHPYLHDKIIASEKGVMVGSHNYLYTGVGLGTAEIALYSTDSQFADAAIKTHERQLQEYNH